MKRHDLVAPCGDYCGGCAQYSGLAVTIARHMRALADLYGFEFRARGAFDFAEFLKGLDWFVAHATCPGCREGGGPAWCQVRGCCVEKDLLLCFECDDFPCAKLDEVADPDTMDRYQRYRELGLQAWVDEQARRAERGYEIHLQKVVSLRSNRLDHSQGP
ncbi:MAG: DUF3795 domain-containing protein [Gemmatimonadota bacterium]|nr:MAG: DUF3795 domain-containing protein [Gemmatimonadota bacterium]